VVLGVELEDERLIRLALGDQILPTRRVRYGAELVLRLHTVMPENAQGAGRRRPGLLLRREDGIERLLCRERLRAVLGDDLEMLRRVADEVVDLAERLGVPAAVEV